MQTDNYLQVPLCFLAYGDTEHDRLEAAISFAFASIGLAIYSKMDDKDRKAKAKEFATDPSTPKDFQRHNEGHVAAMIGAVKLGIRPGGGINASLERYSALKQFRDNLQIQHGTDAQVRIKRDLVFEVRDRRGISYREFSILCAVQSIIGSKQYPVWITREAIQCRMLGYRSRKVMGGEFTKRKDGAELATLRQINYDLDKLDERGFFARVRANKRQTFYSNRMTQSELGAALVTSKSHSRQFHENRRMRDRETMAKIKAIKANGGIKVDVPIKVDKKNGSNDVHSASTGVSTALSTGVSTIIETLLIETPLIETLSIQTRENSGASDSEKLCIEEMRKAAG